MKTLSGPSRDAQSAGGASPVAPRATKGGARAQLKYKVLRLLCGLKVVRAWQFLCQRRKLSILCYHDPDPALFARQVAALKAHFNIIALRDYVKARANNTVDQLPKYPLVITIDDGHVRNFQLLEVIAKEKVPVTIFLTSGVVGTNRHFWWTGVDSEDELGQLKLEPYAGMDLHLANPGGVREAAYPTRQALSEQEIRAMAPFVDFQGHTRFHPVLPLCSMAEAKDEIAGCKKELEDRFTFDIYAFSYPHGRYGEREIALAKQAGYACAVTVEEGLNDVCVNPFQLKRMYILDDADPLEVVVKASGLWTALRRLFGRSALGVQYDV